MSTNRQAHASRKSLYLCVALSLATFFVYWDVQYYEFISFDDARYVYNNDDVLSGLALPTVISAFTKPYFANWHPLTTISFMADATFFGPDPRGFHTINLAFHLMNTVLLYLVLNRMTGAAWRSAAVAALFALHPYHVEPVAWISSRKDVLSTAFWLAAAGAYALYAEQPSRRRMVAVCLLFACALMSKPFAITFPFVLLLLDYWPLRRYGEDFHVTATRAGQLVREKTPLFVLSAVSVPITVYAARAGGAVRDLQQVDMLTRFANVPMAYVMYIVKMFVPIRLVPGGYVTPTDTPIWQTLGALAVILGITAAAILYRRNVPYLAPGWFWFLGMLVPVIGIVSIGFTLRTDRYTYLSIVGLFIVLAWGVPELFRKVGVGDIAARAVAGAAIAACAALTWFQLDYWRDSMSLWSRILEMNPRHPQAHYNVGLLYAQNHEFSKAIPYLAESLEVRPNDTQTMLVLSTTLFALGKMEKAEEVIRATLDLKPDYSLARFHLVKILLTTGRTDEAEVELRELVRREPENANATEQLNALLRQRSG